MDRISSDPALRNELSVKSLIQAAKFSWDAFGISLWKELLSIGN
jgi:hypothetical protein